MKRVVLAVLVVGLMATCLGPPVCATNLTINDVYVPAITGSPPNEALALPTTVVLNSDPVLDDAVNNGSTDLVPLGAAIGNNNYLTTIGSTNRPAPEVAFCVIFETGNLASNLLSTLSANNANPANPWVKTPEVVLVIWEIVASANDLAINPGLISTA